jgi:HK97 family phage prohead protease
MKKTFIHGLVTKIADNVYKVLASTSAIDRQGDSIDQSGWLLNNYLKNPVMLWAHDYAELPVAKATGVQITSKGLELTFEFAPAEANPKAQQIKMLYDEGFLNAVSVGFIPQERNGNIIIRAELLEVSFVPVPANQEALRLALTRGLDENVGNALKAYATVAWKCKAVGNCEDGECECHKGEVADVLNAQEIMEQKYGMLDEVFEVMYAFANVFCDPATSVNDFVPLLSETITLLQKMTTGTVDPEKSLFYQKALPAAILAGAAKSFRATMTEKILAKEGRKLSAKTLEKINKAVEGCDTASSHLRALVDEANVDKQVDVVEPTAPKEPVVEVPVETLKWLQGQLRVNDRQNEFALKIVNDFLEKKKAVTS